MFLYKIEAELPDQTVYVLVGADTDEKAFDYVEGQLLKHFIVLPEINELSIVEKKRLTKGAGYVIETRPPE